MNKKPIGIFDSGVGGLTVLREIERLLPYENIVYFGDTARVPYGNKSRTTIIKFSTQSILFLLRQKVKLVIVACNTSSAVALAELKRTFSIPIIGVIEAAVKEALRISNNNKIGIIGTRSTVKSRSYQREIKKQNRNIKVYLKSCPLFVPLVEEAILNGNIADRIIEIYLQKMRKRGIDTVILGCTHYPLLKEALSRYLKGVSLVDSAQSVADHARELLVESGLANHSRRKGWCRFYVSDEAGNFSKLAKLFLKRNIVKPKVVHV